jgi:hypothetical protein
MSKENEIKNNKKIKFGCFKAVRNENMRMERNTPNSAMPFLQRNCKY